MKKQSLEERLGIKKYTDDELFIIKKIRKRYDIRAYENILYGDFVDLKGGIISEGFYRTYDKSTTLRYVSKVLDIESPNISCVKWNGEYVFKIYLPMKPMQTQQGIDYLKEMDQVFGLCGYYRGVTKSCGAEMLYQYEPKNEKPKADKDEFYWHCTRVDNKDKIDKIGLSPRSNNARFNYPDRVYLFKDTEQLRDIINHATTLEIARREGHNMPASVYSFYKVYPKVKLYTDPNFIPDVAVYTTENIPPSQMEFVGNYDIFSKERVSDDFKHTYYNKRIIGVKNKER